MDKSKLFDTEASSELMVHIDATPSSTAHKRRAEQRSNNVKNGENVRVEKREEDIRQ